MRKWWVSDNFVILQFMIEDLIRERVRKLENFKRAEIEPYPAMSSRTHTISDVLASFEKLTADGVVVVVAGRLMGLRNQGNLFFADLKDGGDKKIQLVVKRDGLDAAHREQFELFRDNLDIGDFVQASGHVFLTQKGERSIEVRALTLLVKSIRPMPDQWSGLTNAETRLRQRYLDIIFNPEVRELFIKKAIFWDTIRTLLKKQNFLEVETPVLEAIPGGADAEPFVTHHNALGVDFYLRISLELPLKKMLVAGYEKVFEIGRVFRNEGIDAEHLQDYATCEFYWAYADYKDLMKFVKKLYKLVVKKVTGGETTSWNGMTIHWNAKWPKIDYYKIFKEKTGLDLRKVSIEQLRNKAIELGLKPEPNLGRGRLIDLVYKKTVRSALIQPCFLVNHPVDISPLSKRSLKNKNAVERVQVVACSLELGNGWSELNDPAEQRKRFEEQVKLREAGDVEAQRMDEDWIEALEHGMPPAAGFGLSERLFAVLMDKSVRETVVFPLMRPKRE